MSTSDLSVFFRPHGVAVIGASSDQEKLGHGVVRNLRKLQYDGPVYPVNPREDEILGYKAYRSMLEVPDPVDLAVIDVSFISLTLVLPAVVPLLNRSAMVVALVKPQFEVGKGQVGRGGIVRDDAQREAVTEKVIACAAHLGLQLKGVLDSPVIGRKGNREILVGFAREITT